MTNSINKQSQVTLHFILKLVNGEVVDSTRDKAPASFTMGDGNLLPGFELALIGLKVGDKKELHILPQQGFGQYNPQNQQVIPISQFKDIELQKGLLIMFHDAANTELPGVVASFNDLEVIVDFNHPLAGKELLFEVEILTVN